MSKPQSYTVKGGIVEMEHEREKMGVLTEVEKAEDEEGEEEAQDDSTNLVHQNAWEPSFYIRTDKEIYYYAGQEITIRESLDSYGAVIWPAALALCQYLDMNQRTVKLLDSSVLEIGAGTGLVSIVASLLGAKVTASDLPEVLGNLRCNLSRNTRWRCRYTPQVMELFWGYDLEETFPCSLHQYDYVLAADVVYHHTYLTELLATMHHFCRPGTTLIWANKIRFASDLAFVENFQKTFNTTILADMGEVKIYSATAKYTEEETSVSATLSEERLEEKEEEEEKDSECEEDRDEKNGNVTDIKKQENSVDTADLETPEKTEDSEHGDTEEIDQNDKECDDEQKENEEEDKSSDLASSELEKEKDSEPEIHRSWKPTSYYRPEREIHYFMGHRITIIETIDSYGGMIWPAAVALCKFLETPAGQEQINLLDKVTLELGAGTGLLSAAATLMGAKLTATDLPEMLGNLRCNLNRNTRGYWRHQPEVATLSWGHNLEQTFPHSEYHYDYILAADVVYHHDYLAELLVTMQYFCQPGTNLIWANKVRYPSDLVFIEDFTKAFHTTLIAEVDEVRIYSAMYKDPDENGSNVQGLDKESDIETNEKEQNSEDFAKVDQTKKMEMKKEHVEEKVEEGGNFGKQEESMGMCEITETSISPTNETCVCTQLNKQLAGGKIWEPSLYYRPDKEIHYFMGHKISIQESIDSYGAMIWPAAVALCQFLETPAGRQNINLLDKSVLEIGAGTGLVSTAATLLGARLTATDLPEILSNLRCNLNRNTRGLRRHEPQITELSWGHQLEENFPHSIYHYDYVLAADVVYHHSFLAELLVTMNHFCQPGTTLIWANKIRYSSDLVFVENFRKTFHTSLIAEVGDVRIYSGTYKEEDDHEINLNEERDRVEEEDKPFLGKAALKAFNGEVKRGGEEEEKVDDHILIELTEGAGERKDESRNGFNPECFNTEETKAEEKPEMITDEGQRGREVNISHFIEQDRCKTELEEESTDEDEGYEEETTDEEINLSRMQRKREEERDVNSASLMAVRSC